MSYPHTWIITFEGRKHGAIGKFYNTDEVIVAYTEAEAIEDLQETYELNHWKIKEMK